MSWTHYRTLLQVSDKEARDWYEKEALEQTWSVQTLQRNISFQYYYRMLQTQRQDLKIWKLYISVDFSAGLSIIKVRTEMFSM